MFPEHSHSLLYYGNRKQSCLLHLPLPTHTVTALMVAELINNMKGNHEGLH